MSAVRGGWRVALRLARREAMRRKGQTALMLVLIVLPVMAVTTAATVWQTQDLSAVEGFDRTMGAAEAIVEPTRADHVAQHFDPGHGKFWQDSTDNELVTLDAVRAAVGEDRPVATLRRLELTFDTDEGRAGTFATEVDPADPLSAGIQRLDEGRWPAAADEIVVNAEFVDRGFGIGDSLTVSREDGFTQLPGEFEIVGIAENSMMRALPALGALPETFGPDDDFTQWLVGGDAVSWDDVMAINAVGGFVTSRDVITDPPPDSALPSEIGPSAGLDEATVTVLVLIVIMVLIEVVLLAGPAFAVRAKAQAHALALVAAAGGTPAQARRTILATGVVIGAAGGVIGVVLGLVAAFAAVPVAQRFQDTWFGPFDVPWVMLAVVAVFGLASAFLAAVIPARSASKQDVVAVLAGRRGEGTPSKRSPLLGLVAIGLGIGGSLLGVAGDNLSPALVGGSAILSVLGMVLLVPVVVSTVARLARRLPLALRFAARDAARHRTRTVPAVAAVGATVAGVIALAIALSSSTTADEQRYQAQLAHGASAMSLDDDLDRTAIEAALASVVGEDVREVRGPEMNFDDRWLELEVASDGEPVGYETWGTLGSQFIVAEDVDPAWGLSAAETDRAEAILADGGAVMFRSSARNAAEGIDTLSFVLQEYDEDGVATSQGSVRVVGAVVGERQGPIPSAGILSPEVAETLGLEVVAAGLVTTTEISRDDARELNERFAAMQNSTYLYVERGYTTDAAERIIQFVLAALGGVLMLGGTLTATFLALSDARPDLATMSAVGAKPRTRRSVAAAYALVVGLVGALLGAPVGFIPGVAISKPLTEDHATGATVLDVPWLLVTIIVVGLPLLTAAVVGLAARSRLPLVARLQ